MPLKRKHYIIGGIIALCLLIIFTYIYARYIEPNQLITKKVVVETKKDTSLKKVVFFSDTQFGSDYRLSNIDKIVKKINESNPDMVIFGGDLIDSYWSDANILDLTHLSLKLDEIKAPQGKYAVWGNHDYGGGAVRIYEQVMHDGGFQILRDNSIYLEESNMNIIGIDDMLMGMNTYYDPNEVVTPNHVIENAFNIFLTHEPDMVDRFYLDDIDLILAAHSHGGQISLPFIGALVTSEGGKKYIEGSYKLKKYPNTFFYVSVGIGTTKLPLRLFNTPEIIELNIKEKM